MNQIVPGNTREYKDDNTRISARQGVVGIAWETGLLVGLAEAGIDVRNADLFVGTSAGATVAAHLRGKPG